MEEIIKRIKNDTNNSPDIIVRNLRISDNEIFLIFNEALCSSVFINDFILKHLTLINPKTSLFESIYNNIPSTNVKELNNYDEVLSLLFEGFSIILVENKFIAVETKAIFDRGVTDSKNEVSIIGPNDAFTENFNKNLGLIRRRIKTHNLIVDSQTIGKQTSTRVGVCYMKNIADKNLVNNIITKLQKIDIDGIIDTGYIREILLDKESIFPTVNLTERPDNVCQALLEGKIAIIVDNTPYAMIIPAFFVDFFHTPDDYYQRSFNITFIRIIRFIAFLLSIFLPAYYISVTTHNPEAIPIRLLTNFASQRLGVPFPGFVEAFIMIICFEILRESDARTPSKVGTSVSILGGLVLGEAAVSAGIVSPIMIIVIAISTISGLLFTQNSLIYSIRYFRIILLILSAFFGIFGIFIGMMFLIIKLCSINSFGIAYTAPFSPLITTELRDSLIKIRSKNLRMRNPILAKKNLIRGKNNEEKN